MMRVSLHNLPAAGPPVRAPIAQEINKYPKALVQTSMSFPSTMISTCEIEKVFFHLDTPTIYYL